MLGDCDVAVAGGAESMSRAPYWLPGMRWGQRMNDGVAIDPMVGALTDPFDACHMGVTAENVADRLRRIPGRPGRPGRREPPPGRGRGRGRILHRADPARRARRARKAPVVDTDEHVRPSVSLDDMAKLRPAFAPDGTVTAGNASGINDAAAAVMLASESFVASSGLTPLGKLAGYAHAGVEPRIMGMGPVPATRKVLDRTGVKVDEIDVFEVNEAFAAQALAVARELDLPPERTNPNGSGISLGHPSAPPAPSSPSSPCTSSSEPAAGTPWSPCASAAARASRRSSSGSDTAPGPSAAVIAACPTRRGHGRQLS